MNYGQATLRAPGNADGMANLQTLNKLHINFLDQKNFTCVVSSYKWPRMLSIESIGFN